MSLPSPQKRPIALRAIVDRLNTARQTLLDQARADFESANPGTPAPKYPIDGPVLPECRYNDPTDLPDSEGRIERHFVIFPRKVGKGPDYIGDGLESEPLAMLEWMIFVPSEHHDQANLIFEQGIAEIEAVLGPCETRLEDPDTGELLAMTFEIGEPDFHTMDVGQAWVLSIFIPLHFTLDATTILS